jgi:light-regulated signal transduction histidine kinase (bacteriophytochrome)
VQDAARIAFDFGSIATELPAVYADLRLAKKALVHVLGNATKYSPPDEPITITAELNGKLVMTSVADRVCGIDDSERTLIFEKLYRGKDHRYVVEGTGMDCPLRVRLSRRTEARCALQAGWVKAAVSLLLCRSIRSYEGQAANSHKGCQK